MMASKGKLLLVDDEPLVLEIIESTLLEDGFDVCCATDSKEALRYLERTSFDGLICDVRLESLDGFDILLIARKKNPNIAAVMISGAPNDTDIQIAGELGAKFLIKPLNLSNLVGTVNLVLAPEPMAANQR